MLRLFEILFPLFQWHACKPAELSASIAKCMATFFTDLHLQLLFPYNFLIPVMYYLCCLFGSWSYGVLLYEILTIGRSSYTTFTFKL